MMKVKDVDPAIRRFFPWALFLILSALFALGAISLARAQSAPDISCEEVVKRVGLKPLWIAEREARREYPAITDAQIAWGRQCVIDHRRAVLEGVENKIKRMF